MKLDQPVAELLGPNAKVPKFKQREIQLIDLATHTSGLPRLPDNMGLLINPLNPYAGYTTDDLDAFLADFKLKREPGSKYNYSNLGMGTLGYALAKRSGKSYNELIEEKICQPLGMHDTTITLSEDQQARLASGIMPFGLPASNWDIPALPGCGADSYHAARSADLSACEYLARQNAFGRSDFIVASAAVYDPREISRQTRNRPGLADHDRGGQNHRLA